MLPGGSSLVKRGLFRRFSGLTPNSLEVSVQSKHTLWSLGDERQRQWG